METSARLIRQSGLVNAERLDTPTLLVGAGGIGSWTALALTKLGMNSVQVDDFDQVEEHNLGSQIYSVADIGNNKAHALQEYITLNSNGRIISNSNRWEPSNLINKQIVISAVDNMETRKLMFEKMCELYDGGNPDYIPRNAVFIDGRMAGNAIHIFTVPISDTEKRLAYTKTLFTDEEADPTPCSERAVAYNVFMCAGVIADHVAHILNGTTPPFEITIDLANYAMYGGL